MHRRVFHFDSLHLVSSLHGIALTYTCGWTQVNTNNNFFKCSWSHAVNFHDRIMSVLNAVPYEGLNITGIQSCFSVWSSRVSQNLFMMRYSKCSHFYVEEHYSEIHQQFMEGFCRLVNLCWSLLYFASLRCSFIPSHVNSLFPVHLIGFKMFLQLFTFSTAYFSSFLFSSSELFWDTLLSN